MPEPAGLIEEVVVGGFRSARDVSVSPGSVCALVGEARSGKSNLLAAIRAALDPSVEVTAADLPRVGANGALDVRVRLTGGGEARFAGTPDDLERAAPAVVPPVVFLPTELRTGAVVAASGPDDAARRIFAGARADRDGNGAADTTGALALVDAVERCCEAGIEGHLLLVEEPELYLRPQAQRYLYRLLRRLADGGNQVIYSTHSPAFLNVARLDELVFVERRATGTTGALQPEPVTPDQDFRVLSEFDAERAELFLARAAILVEGLTEKLALPFVFSALGHDVDAAGITIVECGGKANIVLFARICAAAGVPFLAVYDRDARPGRRPSATNVALAAAIRELAGEDRTVELAPDFEGVVGLERHRNSKPERAWRAFSVLGGEAMPAPLVRVARLALELAAS